MSGLLSLQGSLATDSLLLGSLLHGLKALSLASSLLGARLLLLLRSRLISGAVSVGHDGVRKLHDTGLAVRSLVLVDNALASGLVHETAGGKRSGVGLGAVAGSDSVLDVTGGGLQLGLDGAIAHASFLVGDDALLLALDVGHVVSSFGKGALPSSNAAARKRPIRVAG